MARSPGLTERQPLPQGVWGPLCWHALVPAHLFIFRAMSRAMLRRSTQ